MAHAYDDLWHQMTLTDFFFKRRIICLHPMIILGMTFGALFFTAVHLSCSLKVADTTFWNLIFYINHRIYFNPGSCFHGYSGLE